MTNFYRYITTEGDRWDTIAVKHSRIPYDYVDIIESNSNYQGAIILPSGVTISIPIKEEIGRRVIPPWEKSENRL
jgi:hypothetical protein